MKTPLTATLAAVLALGGGAASAQTYGQAYNAYQAQRDSYYSQQQNYQGQQQDYQAQQRAYADARARYDRDRAAYDARWGYGAYERRYGVFAHTAPHAYAPPATTYPYATYPHAAGAYGYDASYNDAYAPYRDNPCERGNNQTIGGVIGALAGAALGSNLAARNARTEGAVLGGVVGAALGASIGKSTARCDDRGYYYSYDQTRPYREGYYDANNRWRTRSRSTYSYNNGRQCRLAPAPAAYGGTMETRWVRVCADQYGRYRFVG